MTKVTIFARMGIKPENVEQVTALAAKACTAAAYSKEQGCLVVLESYADSAAHFANMQADGHDEMMGTLMALIDSIEFVVLGAPTAEHIAALSKVPGAQLFSEVASI